MSRKSNSIADVEFGLNVKIVEPVNLYRCQLQDEVFVGPFTEIQENVVVGKRTRIQSHSFICSLVTIGNDCFIGHGVMFINDKFSSGGPALGNQEMWKKTVLGNSVSIGSNSTILPVAIADHVVVGAGSVVTKDLEVPGIYVGNPAKLLKKFAQYI